MTFTVGPGIGERMAEMGDEAICDSVFVNLAGTTIEIAQGEKAKYLAHNFAGNWEFSVRPTATPAVTDRRGQLPVRAGASGYPARPLAGVTTACIHYTAGPPERTVDNIARYQTTVQTGDLFPALAYHMFIEKSGEVIWCHDFDRRTWGSGQPGMNEKAVHICYSGNVAPNEAQLAGLKQARLFAESDLGHALMVVGHKDGYATQCPGNTWSTWKAKIL